ncbi:hypothetical protein [Aeromonas hydrophila]|uniref:hypothetical protein n=1 Tax=Aeromonas hydrophila TaxID=644 RepID=UPI0038D15FD0
MSVKDAFFKKVEENIQAKKSSQEAFQVELDAFQEDTNALILEIKSWFDGSPITSAIGVVSLSAGDIRFSVPGLRLQNGKKTLIIEAEGFDYFGVTGVIKVILDDPDRAPRRSEFSIHWKNSLSQISGWVIATKPVANLPAQFMEFNQENFFTKISSFA